MRLERWCNQFTGAQLMSIESQQAKRIATGSTVDTENYRKLRKSGNNVANDTFQSETVWSFRLFSHFLQHHDFSSLARESMKSSTLMIFNRLCSRARVDFFSSPHFKCPNNGSNSIYKQALRLPFIRRFSIKCNFNRKMPDEWRNGLFAVRIIKVRKLTGNEVLKWLKCPLDNQQVTPTNFPTLDGQTCVTEICVCIFAFDVCKLKKNCCEKQLTLRIMRHWVTRTCSGALRNDAKTTQNQVWKAIVRLNPIVSLPQSTIKLPTAS